MKKLMLILLFLTVLISCSSNSTDDPASYEFSETDFEFLPQEYANVGQVYRFKNQENEEIQLKVASFDLREMTGGGIGTSQNLFYYEELEIIMEVINASNDNCDTMKILAAKQQNDFLIWVYELESLFPCSSSQSWQESIDRPFVTSEMTIQGKRYDKVVSLFEGASNIDFYPGYTIDRIYYDLDNGFIGFDDSVQNVEFRIVTE
jgi:hypothetical protein